MSQVSGQAGQLQIELDFPSADRAEAFLGYLRESVWKGNPVVDGTPEARILEPVALQPA